MSYRRSYGCSHPWHMDVLGRLEVKKVCVETAGAPGAAAGGGVALQLPVLHAVDGGRPVRHARQGRAAPLARPPLHRRGASAETCAGNGHPAFTLFSVSSSHFSESCKYFPDTDLQAAML